MRAEPTGQPASRFAGLWMCIGAHSDRAQYANPRLRESWPSAGFRQASRQTAGQPVGRLYRCQARTKMRPRPGMVYQMHADYHTRTAGYFDQ